MSNYILFYLKEKPLEFTPLTLVQANLLAQDYQSLMGKKFTNDQKWKPIECVTAAPYDELNKWIFLEFYKDLRNAEKCLAQYPGHFFDVIVIAASAVSTGEQFAFRDMKSYLAEFPEAVEKTSDLAYSIR